MPLPSPPPQQSLLSTLAYPSRRKPLSSHLTCLSSVFPSRDPSFICILKSQNWRHINSKWRLHSPQPFPEEFNKLHGEIKIDHEAASKGNISCQESTYAKGGLVVGKIAENLSRLGGGWNKVCSFGKRENKLLLGYNRGNRHWEVFRVGRGVTEGGSSNRVSGETQPRQPWK